MLSFASAPGNLFNIIGKCGLLVESMSDNQDTQLTNMTDETNGVVGQLNGEPDIQALMGNSYISLLNSAGTVGNTAQTIARAALNRLVFRDNPRPGQTLQAGDITASLREVIRQMGVAGATVLAHTITATPTSFTGTGNGVIVASFRRPLDGKVLENIYAETMKLVCTSDSYSGGATAGNESFAIQTTGAQSNFYAFDWPLGSGGSNSLSAINGAADNTQGNVLNNSGFEDFTSNVPDNWTLVVGTAGTHIFEETTLVYDSPPNTAVRILGDGSNLTQIRQRFGISTGTSGTLTAERQYSFNMFLRRDGVAPAAGVMTIDLVDQNFNVIQDNLGTNNTFTIDLTALSTVYTAYNGIFRTPSILPSHQYIRIRLSTALTTGRSIYIDKGSLGLMTQVYRSGGYLSLHAGSIPFQINDFATVPWTNSRGVAGSLNTFQTLMSRFFNEMYTQELLIPSSSVPTISDGLIG